ncbi:MFS transporter [Bradyrhizobium liaoningense]|uniref:MFS transporter n=1 Tax=Bradyrhizobium liaoningense TaxID=43992 RepID=UPI001BA63DC5|nr:MFS transporter [Bradyrhizobium liaoningense]MBR0859132.1 MFS transporter [Bradyrhizobium liaoningense]
MLTTAEANLGPAVIAQDDQSSQSRSDLLSLISTRRMSRAQLFAAAVGIAINAIDGYDVLAISFAAPGIAKEWGIDRSGLGIVLSMELIGMAFGSLVLGRVADQIGRRPMLLICEIAMAFSMLMCATANDVTMLALWRLVVGVSIGGVLPALTSMMAESSSQRGRDVSVTLLGVGYSAGAIFGGSIAAWLLKYYDWRSMFIMGAAATMIGAVLTYVLVPETIAFLLKRQPKNALARINAIAQRFQLPTISRLPDTNSNEVKGAVRSVFDRDLLRNTIVVPLAYLFCMITFYFPLKWAPKLIADMGYTPSEGASVLVWINIGGLIGSLAVAASASRLSLRITTPIILIVGAISLVAFGATATDLSTFKYVGAVMGFFLNASVVCLFAAIARSFPASVRATGAGISLGIGRAGSVLAPVVAGFMFASGFNLAFVSSVMAVGCLISAGLLACSQPKD